MTDSDPDNRADDDAARLAREAGASMYQRDVASQALGIELVEIRPGYARMSMTVTGSMLQGHAVCHGGLLFTLADTAMAFASNSHNESHLALNANIDFLRPAELGDVLTAEAVEDNRTRRTGMYNVSIENQKGQAVAHFRGRTYGVGGAVLR
ncbi:MAG: hydroxyphenylacetyl-CoA thioesterase PaaI [Gammaproteobacteria bacterium]